MEHSHEHSHGKVLGEVSNYFDHVGVAAIKLEGSLKVGDEIHIVGGDVHDNEKVISMQIHGKNISSAKKGDEVGIKVSHKLRKGYKIYKV